MPNIKITLSFNWLGGYLNFNLWFVKNHEYLNMKWSNYEINAILWKTKQRLCTMS
jgi:hypothetical protein